MGALGSFTPGLVSLTGLSNLLHQPRETSGVRAGEVHAHRGWRLCVRTGALYSLSVPVVWVPGKPMHGEVGMQTALGLGLGVYAWKKADDARRYNRHAVAWTETMPVIIGGTIDLWGTIVEHELGYRAELGAIASLDYIIHASTNITDEILAELQERYLG